MIECTPSLLESGVPTIAWIATHLRISWLTPLIQAVSDLGKEGNIIFTIALAYWLWNKRYTTYLGYAMFTALLLNFMLKGWVMECRPPEQYWLEIVHSSYSFPSGHTQVATPLWLGFAYYVRNKWLRCLFLFLGLMIGLSRPYLGVHFVHDIVVGGILGTAVFVLFIVSEQKNWLLIQRLSLLKKFVFMALVLGIYFLLLRQVTPPVIKGVSALVGFWLGCQCDGLGLRFINPKRIKSMLGLTFIGVIGTLLIWKGMKIFGDAMSITVFQYSLLGWWITFGAPWLHRQITKVINRSSGQSLCTPCE